ncbi:MAG: hypothetical protein RR891_00395 [Clostridium sp.]|uniref:hypothetical protein n=1 Tax=Clostridium sp. TaxID=1506 RepID=UPI00304F3E78
MEKLLHPVKESDFKEKVHIRFKNINQGFDDFENAILQSDDIENAEENIIKFMNEAFRLNGDENSYVDFYFQVLSEEDKSRLISLLSKEDKVLIEKFIENQAVEKQQEQNIYFKLTEESIPFITRLSTREVLFCTVYFTKIPFTIWGNYNKKFPCFFEENDILEVYRNIADKYNLEII